MNEDTRIVGQAVKAAADRGGKYLTFTLGSEEYGIAIEKVREIIGMMPITPMPHTPGYVKGVINLRGKVSPVVNLRLKFGMEEIQYTDRTCIILLEVAGDESVILMGIIVDTVSEVLNIRDDDIENAPSFGENLDMEFISGIAKMEGGVKILLNIDKVVRADEIKMIKVDEE